MPKLSEVMAYLRYLLLHKWFVLIECAKHGLWWRGLTHDWSKFLPDEFLAYVHHFHGKNKYRDSQADESNLGYSKPENTHDPAFEKAWFKHQRRNDHHWQWWVCITSKSRHIPMEMSAGARLEMICDWRGAGRAQGKPDIRGWYEAHRVGILLHPETRKWVDENL